MQNLTQDLWKLLVEKDAISMDNVRMLRRIARFLNSEELGKEIEIYENEYSGTVQKADHLETCLGVLKGGFRFSVIMLKTFLRNATQIAAVTGTVLYIIQLFRDNPEALKTLLSDILPYGMDLIGLKKGSLYFVLETSSLSSLQQLWTSYKDGSLEKKFKNVINDIDDVQKLTQGTEIDVTVEIDEDEYCESCWVLWLAKIHQNEEARNVQKLRQRRHSLSCARDFSRDKTQLSWQKLRAFNKVENELDYETRQRICEKQPSAESRGQEMGVREGTTVNANSEEEDLTAIDDETRKLISASDQKKIEKLKKEIKSREDKLKSVVKSDDKNEVGTAYREAGLYCYVLGTLYGTTNEKEKSEDSMKKAKSYFREAADSWEKLNAQLNNDDEKSVIDHSLFITYQLLTAVLLATKQTEEALIISDNMRDRRLVDTMIEKFQMTNRNQKKILSESMRCAKISSILEDEHVSVFIYSVHRGNKINIWTLDYQKPSIFLETIVPASGTESAYEALAFSKLMYELLIAPVLPNLTQDRLVIIADGTHQLVPFAALRDPETGRFLSEIKCIRYAPSLAAMKVWKECPVDYHAKTGALVVGDPDVGTVFFEGKEYDFPRSPFAQREAMVVGALLSANLLVGPQATKYEVLKRFQEPLAIII